MDRGQAMAKESKGKGSQAPHLGRIKSILIGVLTAALIVTVPASAFAEEPQNSQGGEGLVLSIDGVLNQGIEIGFNDVSAQDSEYSAQATSFAADMFLDTPQTAWYVKDGSLDYAVDNQLMNGYTDGDDAGKFLPYGDITRGQVATVLWRMAGKPAALSAKSFKDLTNSKAYYYDAVLWAASVGVAEGYTNKAGNLTGYFGANDPVTREQLTKMLAEFASKVGKLSIASDCKAMDKIKNASSVSTWAREYMGWAVDQGLLSGVDKKGVRYLEPTDNAWRASVAKMIMGLRKDVMKMPYSSTTQSQREQTLLKAIDDELKRTKNDAVVTIVPAEQGRARYYQIRYVLNYDLNTTQSLLENKQNRDTYMESCSIVQKNTEIVYGWNIKYGVNLQARGVVVSSDLVTVFECFNGAQVYQRF